VFGHDYLLFHTIGEEYRIREVRERGPRGDYLDLRERKKYEVGET
jgi:hypothetical protein